MDEPKESSTEEGDPMTAGAGDVMTGEGAALAAIVAGFKHDGAYRKTVEDHARIILDHLLALPVEQRMDAMGICDDCLSPRSVHEWGSGSECRLAKERADA